MLHRFFEEQVARNPAAIAIAGATEDVTYGELNRRANRIAHRIRQTGLGPEDRVGVHLDRSPDLIAALLGVLKAGPAFVPIDASYPARRIASTLEDAGAQLLITTRELFARLSSPLIEALCLDRSHWHLLDEPSDDLEEVATPANASYVIYTSGSTGRPKGVVVEHSQLDHLVIATRHLFDIRPDDRVLYFASPGFDVSVWEMVLALTNGATLVVPSETRRLWRLRDVFRDSKVTVSISTPMVVAGLDEDALRTVRILSIGGEKFISEQAKWANSLELYNGYGPTETTVVATSHRVRDAERGEPRVPIGTALEGCATYVLDRDLRAAAEGELFIGGRGVARGYLGRPALTAERFLPDPFSGTPGARMYATGDLVRRRPDGELDYFGRVDDQVQISGFRIEPGEIEAALLREGVREAAVVAEVGESGVPSLTAYIAGAGSRSADDLRAALLGVLPSHMVPIAYVCLDELPVTANGKLDRGRLPELAGRPTTALAPVGEGLREDLVLRVVENELGQFSVWPADREAPVGWKTWGEPGTLAECLTNIEEIWQDIRPRSSQIS